MKIGERMCYPTRYSNWCWMPHYSNQFDTELHQHMRHRIYIRCYGRVRVVQQPLYIQFGRMRDRV